MHSREVKKFKERLVIQHLRLLKYDNVKGFHVQIVSFAAARNGRRNYPPPPAPRSSKSSRIIYIFYDHKNLLVLMYHHIGRLPNVRETNVLL